MGVSRAAIVAAVIGAVAAILAALITALLSSAAQSNYCPADRSSHSTCTINSLQNRGRPALVTGAAPEDHDVGELSGRTSGVSWR